MIQDKFPGIDDVLREEGGVLRLFNHPLYGRYVRINDNQGKTVQYPVGKRLIVNEFYLGDLDGDSGNRLERLLTKLSKLTQNEEARDQRTQIRQIPECGLDNWIFEGFVLKARAIPGGDIKTGIFYPDGSERKRGSSETKVSSVVSSRFSDAYHHFNNVVPEKVIRALIMGLKIDYAIRKLYPNSEVNLAEVNRFTSQEDLISPEELRSAIRLNPDLLGILGIGLLAGRMYSGS